MRVDEHTFQLDDSPVYYRSAEAPGMPKLYLHGIPTSSDDWLEFLPRTGGIAPDLIGFGRSGKGGHLDYSLDGLANFVDRFLSHIGAGELLQVVGHDWGAAVALTFARRHPGRVRRLVLMNAPPLIGAFEWPRLFRLWRTSALGELLMGATTRRLLARTLRRGSVRPDAWPDERIAAVWDQFDQGTQRAILRLVRSAWDDGLGSGGSRAYEEGGAAGEPRASREGGAADEPRTSRDERAPGEGDAPGEGRAPGEVAETAIVWGEQDPWYPPALADAYAARLPGATVERLAGAGHWPWLDRPEVVDRVASLLEG